MFSRVRMLASRIRGWVSRRNVDAEFEQELEGHLEMLTEENIGRGMTADEAGRAARIQLGGWAQLKETNRELRGLPMIETFVQDIRYALRMLRKDLGFTGVAVLTLALGIGASSAVFSMVNSFLLRPLPVNDGQNLMVLAISHDGNLEPHNPSYLDTLFYKENSGVFSDIAGYAVQFVGLTSEGHSERIAACFVTGNYFSLLGVQPAYGRFILPGEGQTPGADPILVLSHQYWKRRFQGNPAVIGKVVRVNGHAVTIVGVAPEGFHGTMSIAEMDAYLPISLSVFDPDMHELMIKRDQHSLRTLARLKPGVKMAQARASLKVATQQLAAQFPATSKGLEVYLFPERLARPEPSSATQNPFVAMIFLALAVLVLLVACLNVANMLLARAAVRNREMAIRSALGAERLRLIRQWLTESLLLAFLGGVAGAVLGSWTSKLLSGIHVPGDLPIRFDFSFDWRVFCCIAAIVVFTAVVAGLAPALRASRSDVTEVLREGGRSLAGGVGRNRLLNALVVSQVAGSLVLLIVAGLFTRSLSHAQQVDLGFQPKNVINFSVNVSQLGYDDARGKAFFPMVEERVRALPGVESTSFAYSVPMQHYSLSALVIAEGQALPPGDTGIGAGYNAVGNGYFATMRAQVLEGRAFTDEDREGARRVAIVNELLAHRLWPGINPIGKRFGYDGPQGPYVEVVGVASNGKYGQILEDPQPYFYVPLAQNYHPVRVLHVRTTAASETLALAVVKEVHSLEPDLPVYDVMTMEQALEGINALFLIRMAALFAAVLGVLGVTLAVIGVYGVVSYMTGQHTHEIGVRMALGAHESAIFKAVVGQGMRFVLLGACIGLPVAFALGHFLSRILFGVKPYDPVSSLGSIVLLGVVAFAACYLPARRAARTDPMVALRYE